MGTARAAPIGAAGVCRLCPAAASYHASMGAAGAISASVRTAQAALGIRLGEGNSGGTCAWGQRGRGTGGGA